MALAKDIHFDSWHEQGLRLIQQNSDVFRNLIVQVRELLHRNQYEEAARLGEIAALHAVAKHCGFFVSFELEDILLTIGQKVIPKTLHSTNKGSSLGSSKNVLHVVSNASAFIGVSRLVWRWIYQDSERSHSVVLTRQMLQNIPQIIGDVVAKSHGKIYELSKGTDDSYISRAKQLREIASSADIVVLHGGDCDVIPIMAFADKEYSPPTIYVNHSDHRFWLGASVSNVIANLRESGMFLSRERRNIQAERNTLLPTILNPIQRTLSRAEAKRQLGIAEDRVLLLSIARRPKYATVNGVSFAEAHVPLLKRYNQTLLIIVGPGNRKDWLPAIHQTQGRIKVFEQTEETSLLYQAADIYVDSFPITSITSLLEAGSYGTPLVSRNHYSRACSILGADAPGLTNNLIGVRDLEEYTTVLSRLVEDEEFRLSLGEATRKKIAETHWGNSWQHYLNDVYVRAATLPRVDIAPGSIDKIFWGEPDVFIQHMYGHDIDFEYIVYCYLNSMPLVQRRYVWTKLAKSYGYSSMIWLLPIRFFYRYLYIHNYLRNILYK